MARPGHHPVSAPEHPVAAVTAYLSRAAIRLLTAAQRTIDDHPLTMADGTCQRCHVPGPCAALVTASKVFARYHQLPRRLPGASRPELVGARRVAVGRR